MTLNPETERNVVLKKTFGKAHTDNAKGVPNEARPSFLQVLAAAVMSGNVPAAPSKAALYDITDDVEFVRLELIPDPSANGHAFLARLPADYEANSTNPNAGSGVFVNGQVVSETQGFLQIIAPTVAADYEATPYRGGTSAQGSGTVVSPVDPVEFLIDYTNGVIFQEDDPTTGSPDMTYLECLIYIGEFGNFSTGGGGGGGVWKGDWDISPNLANIPGAGGPTAVNLVNATYDSGTQTVDFSSLPAVPFTFGVATFDNATDITSSVSGARRFAVDPGNTFDNNEFAFLYGYTNDPDNIIADITVLFSGNPPWALTNPNTDIFLVSYADDGGSQQSQPLIIHNGGAGFEGSNPIPDNGWAPYPTAAPGRKSATEQLVAYLSVEAGGDVHWFAGVEEKDKSTYDFNTGASATIAKEGTYAAFVMLVNVSGAVTTPPSVIVDFNGGVASPDIEGLPVTTFGLEGGDQASWDLAKGGSGVMHDGLGGAGSTIDVTQVTAFPDVTLVGDEYIVSNYASALVGLESGSSGSVDSITVNSVEILSGPVAFDTDLDTTAGLVAANITANTSAPNYSAVANGSDIIISTSDTAVTGPFTVEVTFTDITGTAYDLQLRSANPFEQGLVLTSEEVVKAINVTPSEEKIDRVTPQPVPTSTNDILNGAQKVGGLTASDAIDNVYEMAVTVLTVTDGDTSSESHFATWQDAYNAAVSVDGPVDIIFDFTDNSGGNLPTMSVQKWDAPQNTPASVTVPYLNIETGLYDLAGNGIRVIGRTRKDPVASTSFQPGIRFQTGSGFVDPFHIENMVIICDKTDAPSLRQDPVGSDGVGHVVFKDITTWMEASNSTPVYDADNPFVIFQGDISHRKDGGGPASTENLVRSAGNGTIVFDSCNNFYSDNTQTFHVSGGFTVNTGETSEIYTFYHNGLATTRESVTAVGGGSLNHAAAKGVFDPTTADILDEFSNYDPANGDEVLKDITDALLRATATGRTDDTIKSSDFTMDFEKGSFVIINTQAAGPSQVGSVEFSGSSGSVDQIYANGVPLMSSSVPFSTTLSLTITNVVNNIQANAANHKYTASKFLSDTVQIANADYFDTTPATITVDVTATMSADTITNIGVGAGVTMTLPVPSDTATTSTAAGFVTKFYKAQDLGKLTITSDTPSAEDINNLGVGNDLIIDGPDSKGLYQIEWDSVLFGWNIRKLTGKDGFRGIKPLFGTITVRPNDFGHYNGYARGDSPLVYFDTSSKFNDGSSCIYTFSGVTEIRFQMEISGWNGFYVNDPNRNTKYTSTNTVSGLDPTKVYTTLISRSYDISVVDSVDIFIPEANEITTVVSPKVTYDPTASVSEEVNGVYNTLQKAIDAVNLARNNRVSIPAVIYFDTDNVDNTTETALDFTGIRLEGVWQSNMDDWPQWNFQINNVIAAGTTDFEIKNLHVYHFGAASGAYAWELPDGETARVTLSGDMTLGHDNFGSFWLSESGGTEDGSLYLIVQDRASISGSAKAAEFAASSINTLVVRDYVNLTNQTFSFEPETINLVVESLVPNRVNGTTFNDYAALNSLTKQGEYIATAQTTNGTTYINFDLSNQVFVADDEESVTDVLYVSIVGEQTGGTAGTVGSKYIRQFVFNEIKPKEGSAFFESLIKTISDFEVPKAGTWESAVNDYRIWHTLWDGSQYVALGKSTNVSEVDGILTSPDAITWTLRQSITAGTKIFHDSVNGEYIVGGESGELWTSTDAVTWTSRTSNVVGDITGIAFDGTNYAIKGGSTEISKSTDLITWTAASPTGLGSATDLHWSSALNKFLVVDDFADVYSSADAETWAIQFDLPESTAVTISDIVEGNGKLVYGYEDGAAYFAISEDGGANWTTQIASAPVTQWFGFANGYFYISVSDPGFRSADLENWEYMSGGSGTLQYSRMLTYNGADVKMGAQNSLVTWTLDEPLAPTVKIGHQSAGLSVQPKLFIRGEANKTIQWTYKQQVISF